MNWKLPVTLGGVIVIIGLALLLNPFVIVSAGERGVVLNWGKVSDTVLDEGIHWRTPFSQSIEKMDVTINKEEAESNAASKDLQSVTAKVALNYHVRPEKANVVYQNYRQGYGERLLMPAIQEVIKSVTARYTAEELVTKRESVKDDMVKLLKERIEAQNIIVDNISITNFEFSGQFNAAIESKQTAVQNALKAKNELETVKIEAEKRVTEAKAEAEAIRIQAEAIMQQGGDNYVQMKAIERWDGKLPAQMIPGATVPFINVTK